MKALDQEYVFDEPRGHGGRFSKIERVWRKLPSGYSVGVRRTERFDSVSNLLYSPVEYIAEDISTKLPEGLPDDDWVINSFLRFVVGEFESHHMRTPPDSFNMIEQVPNTVPNAPEIYLEKCESELVYGGILRGLNTRRSGSIENAIFNVLSSPLLGNPVNQRFLDKDAFAAAITPTLQEHKRLQFVFPGFPFKDQNIFRTEASPDHIDMGEIALVIRLHALALAFFQIHPFGADWIILSDGQSYASVLGVDPTLAEAYQENLRGMRNRLNLQGTVSLLDLDQIAKHTDGERFKGRFEETITGIYKKLRMLIGINDALKRSYSVLVRGMMWNLSTRHYEKNYSRQDIWRAVAENAAHYSELAKEILDKAENAAYYYGAYNLALRWLNIPQCVFPDAIRMTVHPKPGQVAVPSMGNVYPWNGIPVVHQATFRANDITVSPWFELQKKEKSLLGHIERNSQAPLYYSLK